jgi:hypothetical protein
VQREKSTSPEGISCVTTTLPRELWSAAVNKNFGCTWPAKGVDVASICFVRRNIWANPGNRHATTVCFGSLTRFVRRRLGTKSRCKVRNRLLECPAQIMPVEIRQNWNQRSGRTDGQLDEENQQYLSLDACGTCSGGEAGGRPHCTSPLIQRTGGPLTLYSGFRSHPSALGTEREVKAAERWSSFCRERRRATTHRYPGRHRDYQGAHARQSEVLGGMHESRANFCMLLRLIAIALLGAGDLSNAWPAPQRF